MKEKILITGANGFLAPRLLSYYKKNNYETLGITRNELDITDELMCNIMLDDFRPDVILHCAAYSNVTFCEEHPKETFEVNVDSCVNLAKAAKRTGSRLVFMSSDQVYTGSIKREPNREDEQCNPINEYGKQKLLAEDRILNTLNTSICLRLSWMYDDPKETMKNNMDFYHTLVNALKNQSQVSFKSYEYRGITYVKQLVENMPTIMNIDAGVYNAGCTNDVNTYELGKEALEILGATKEQIKYIINEEKSDKELIKNLSMDIDKILSKKVSFTSSKQAFKECVNTVSFK